MKTLTYMSESFVKRWLVIEFDDNCFPEQTMREGETELWWGTLLPPPLAVVNQSNHSQVKKCPNINSEKAWELEGCLFSASGSSHSLHSLAFYLALRKSYCRSLGAPIR